MSGVESQRAMLFAQIRNAQAKLEQLERIPVEDTYPDNTVLKLRVLPRYARNEELTYVFLKIRAEDAHSPKWYFTGDMFGRTRDHSRWAKWETIVSWLMSDVELVSWDELTPKTVGEAVQQMFPAE